MTSKPRADRLPEVGSWVSFGVADHLLGINWAIRVQRACTKMHSFYCMEALILQVLSPMPWLRSETVRSQPTRQALAIRNPSSAIRAAHRATPPRQLRRVHHRRRISVTPVPAGILGSCVSMLID